MTAEKEVIIHETPAEWVPKIRAIDEKSRAVVNDRKNVPDSVIKEIILDRDRRFYWAILVFKTGLYNYHVKHDLYKEMYSNCLKSIKGGIKEGWDEYVNEITVRNVPRATILEALPNYEEAEFVVEWTIEVAEFLRSVMVDGGCSPVMFEVEPLEMLSAMIDEGCVDAESERYRMKVIKEPSFKGWERYFGPGVTRVNMQ